MNKEDKDFKPEFANWNQFYVDLFSQITKIRDLNAAVLFDVNKVPLFYSMINSLFVTHSEYIINKPFWRGKLNKIKLRIWSDEYNTAVKTKNTKLKLVQLKIIWDLEEIFEHMCSSFAKKGLSVKVYEIQKDDPSRAVMRGYN